MGSSVAPSPPPLYPSTCCDPFRLPREPALIRPSNSFRGSIISRPRRICLLSPLSVRGTGASWGPSGSSNDGFGGWLVSQPEVEKKKDFPKFLIVGIGTSVAVLLAAFAHCSFLREGFRFRFDMPFHAFHGLLMPSESASTLVNEDNPISEIKLEDKPGMTYDAFDQTMDNSVSAPGGKNRLVVPMVADSTQQEALFILKKLKIIENDVKPDELCTRREYARWLIKANSLLERNPKHKIIPSMLIAGSTITAFDDVSVTDPDLWCIQALGEAGIVPCKLSAVKSSLSNEDSLDSQGTFDFAPESFLSRLDLVNWRAQLEYLFVPGIEEKVSSKKVDFMDLGTMSSDALPELFMDLLVGDKSIVRRVFGNIRRLQPHKPTTKAQAAVSLTSGRMAESICIELSRVEAENTSRLAEMEEIRSELIRRGEIQKFWEEKLNEEKVRGLEVQSDYLTSLHDLEEGKMARDMDLANHMKEKAALDCQRQLLVGLKEEVDGMHGRLAIERANLLVEQQSLEEQFIDLRDKQDAIAEAKSILEVEKEALRILRSWVEEEACRSQLRAKVLEAAAQRWKWDDQFGLSQTCSPESRDER